MPTNRNVSFWLDLLLVILRAIRELLDDETVEATPAAVSRIKVE